MTKARIATLEKQLQSDIRWAIRKKGMKWDANKPALFVDGKWAPKDAVMWPGSRLPKVCGVCAVAAHVVRHQTKAPTDPGQDCVDSAAKNLHVPVLWLNELFFAVMDDPANDSPQYDSDAHQLGHRLRDYAEAYTKRYRAEKRRKAAE